jgi:hypothetical protein
MRQCGWQVIFNHCPAIAQILLSPALQSSVFHCVGLIAFVLHEMRPFVNHLMHIILQQDGQCTLKHVHATTFAV